MASLDDHRQRLTRNTAYLTVASVGQKVISFFYFLIFANALGTETTGSFFFALAFANLFGILVDVGLSPLLIREVARNPQRAPSLFRSTLRFKLLTAVLVLGLLALVAPQTVQGTLRLQLLSFTALVMVFESLSLTAYGVLRGLQQLRFEAIGSTLHQLTVFLVGASGVLITRNPIWLGVAILAASIVNLAFALTAVRRALRPFGRPLTTPRLPWGFGTILPFFFSGVLTRLYAYLDVVIIGFLTADRYVGLYGAAYKIAYATQFLPVSFNASVYPALSQAFRESTETLKHLAERSLRFLLTLSLPLSTLVFLNARAILQFASPPFLEASRALQISVLTLPFLFSNFLFSSLLNATNRQTRNTVILLAAVSLNAILNLLLVPRWHHVGASLAALASTVSITILSLQSTRSAIAWRRESWGFLLRLLGAVAVTAVVGLLLRPTGLPVLLMLTLEALVFGAIVLLMRAYRLSDFTQLIASFRRRTA